MMLKNIFTFLLTLFVLFSFEQNVGNETVIYSFVTKNGKKVSIIKEKDNAYIYYQFTNGKKVELQYPSLKNKESWKLFSYNFYMRGGGKNNAGMEIANLQFVNKGIQYLIYQTYFSETEELKTGIIITNLKTKKETRINGIYKTVHGSLFSLDQETPLVMEDIGLSF